MSFIPLTENGVLCSLSKEFREAAEADCLWRGAYAARFGNGSGARRAHRPSSRRPSDATIASPPGNTVAQKTETMTPCVGGTLTGEGFKDKFMKRLLDPQVKIQIQ